MNRRPMILLAIALMLAVLAVSCNPSVAVTGKKGLTTFYSTAREAVSLSTGVTLPEIDDIGLDPSDPDAYNAELSLLKDVISRGGSKQFTFDLNTGISSQADDKIVSAVSDVFGAEVAGYPQNPGGCKVDMWAKDDLQVMVAYFTDNSRITIAVY